MNVGFTLLIYGFAGLVIIAPLVISFAFGWVRSGLSKIRRRTLTEEGKYDREQEEGLPTDHWVYKRAEGGEAAPLIDDTKEPLDRMYHLKPLNHDDIDLAEFIETWSEILIILNRRAMSGLEHFSFHRFRHSQATLLFQMGYTPDTIGYFLGHSDKEITKGVYIHQTEEGKKDIADRLDARLKELFSKTP